MRMRFILAFIAFLGAFGAKVAVAADWRTASHAPAGLAPHAATTPEAVIQVYGARTWGWKGTFGVHTWVAVKPANADSYTVYEVIGWRLRWSDSVVSIGRRQPDADRVERDGLRVAVVKDAPQVLRGLVLPEQTPELPISQHPIPSLVGAVLPAPSTGDGNRPGRPGTPADARGKALTPCPWRRAGPAPRPGRGSGAP